MSADGLITIQSEAAIHTMIGVLRAIATAAISAEEAEE